MEMQLPLYILDVFAERKYSGNQLAAVRRAQGLSENTMQQIAREMNYAETTFIPSDNEQHGGYDARIFTPKAELAFAGHPTLGTAYLIQQEIVRRPVEKIVLNLKIGQIPVTFEYHDHNPNRLWMKQKQPVFGHVYDSKTVSEILSITPKEIDERFPIQDVSTGLPAIVVPLKTLDAVKKSRLVREPYLNLVRDANAKNILIFCPETYSRENQLNVRVFADYYGIPEDPATGSANGCLTAYLTKYQYFGEARVSARVEQGYEIGRPSLIFLNGEETRAGIEVRVGGHVILVAKGELL